jgi:hypothetical protein
LSKEEVGDGDLEIDKVAEEVGEDQAADLTYQKQI